MAPQVLPYHQISDIETICRAVTYGIPNAKSGTFFSFFNWRYLHGRKVSVSQSDSTNVTRLSLLSLVTLLMGRAPVFFHIFYSIF